MKKDSATLSQDYFDKLYTKTTDPWDFEKSEYERLKYQKTIVSLPNDRYHSALEVGCSIGVLTEKLAKHCDELLSIDISEHALETAKKRLAAIKNVRLEKAAIPEGFPIGNYDLLVLSEVGYYLDLRDLFKAKKLIKDNLQRGGDLILVHWTHYVSDYPLTGDQVHEVFLKDEDFKKLTEFRTADYRLDVLRKI